MAVIQFTVPKLDVHFHMQVQFLHSSELTALNKGKIMALLQNSTFTTVSNHGFRVGDKIDFITTRSCKWWVRLWRFITFRKSYITVKDTYIVQSVDNDTVLTAMPLAAVQAKRLRGID